MAEATADSGEGETGSSRTGDSVSDPEASIDRDDIEQFERTYLHADADYCEADATGRAIVGVTNDASEVLLLVHWEGPHVVLPNCTVDADEDWAAVGRRTVEEATGVTVAIEAPERVRTIDHVVEGETDPLGTSQHVVFSASPVAVESERDEPETDDEDWEVGWFDEIPVPVDADQPVAVADAIDDVRSFLD